MKKNHLTRITNEIGKAYLNDCGCIRLFHVYSRLFAGFETLVRFQNIHKNHKNFVRIPNVYADSVIMNV
jgi:hypothetical protein